MGKCKNVVRQCGSLSGVFVKGLVIFTFILGVFCGAHASAQTYEPGDNDRKVIKRVDPEYPETLKQLYIGGVVRVEATVAPNGTVLSTKLVGGSPILGQAAMKAIKQWKYAPAGGEQTITVKIDFDPHR
jgi:TonB family protein